MAELKTKLNDASVDAFLAGVADDDKRAFAQRVAQMMAAASGEPAKMWGSSIVGFGQYTYRYESGRSGEWMRVGFSPRKQAMTLYIMSGFAAYEDLLARLGKYKTGKSCLYVKREGDIDMGVLRELVDASLACMRERYPEPGSAEATGTAKPAAKARAKSRPSAKAKAKAKARPNAKAKAKSRPNAKAAARARPNAKAAARARPKAKAKAKAKRSAKKSAKSQA